MYNLKLADANAELDLKSTQGPQVVPEEDDASTTAADAGNPRKGAIDYEKNRDAVDAFKRDMIYTRMRREEAEHRMCVGHTYRRSPLLSLSSFSHLTVLRDGCPLWIVTLVLISSI